MLDLYKNIKKFRKKNGWSQMELAVRTGYTDRSSIAKIEKGQIDLPQSKIFQFADVFGVTPGELMGNDGLEQPMGYDWQEYSEFISELKEDERLRFEDFLHRMERYYRKLNENGQEHLLQTAADMTQIDRFKK